MTQLFEKKTNARIQILEKREDGYLVSNPQFPDDQYVIPFDVFESTYRPVGESLTFGQAIEAMKQGHRVTRKGWNGKGQWVVLMPALYLSSDVVNQRTQKHIGVGVDLDSQPYMALWNAQGKWQPGWVPSVSDCLADDWVIAENG